MNYKPVENEQKIDLRTLFPFQYYYQEIPDIFLHWHNHLEFVFVEKGNFTLFVDAKPYPIKPGDIFVITPGKIHFSKQDIGTKILCRTYILNLEFLESHALDVNEVKYISPLLTGDIVFPCVLHEDHPIYSSVKDLLWKIADDYTLKEVGHELLVKAHFYTILAIYFKNFALDGAKSKKQRISLEKLTEVVRYVDSNLSRSISIKDAADKLGYSKSYFCRFFKANTGQTFTEYTNYRRISNAISLLLETSYSITEIAYEVGFDDLSYFNKVFKKETGLSPTKYRNKNQGLLVK